MSTIFGKIIKGELSAEKVYEDKNLLAIKDIAPAAPVHLLIITKKEIPSFQEIQKGDMSLLLEVATLAQKLAKEFGVENNYRLVTNVGTKSGQSIFHLHFHLIGGSRLGSLA